MWTNLTTDTNAVDGLRISYGIQGNGPLANVSGTGECSVTLQNHAGNSGAQQGYYSPNHSRKRAGWNYGIPFRVVFQHDDDDAISVSSITRTGQTAHVTTAADHGLDDGDWVTIAGANQTDYNGRFEITFTGWDTFDYAVSGNPATPATGTITATRVYIKHRGKVRVINPHAGQYRDQLVDVVSYDGMRDLAETDVREVSLQVDQTEAELIDAVLDALSADSQPVARDFDAGVDTFPYAFDDVGGGRKALGVIKDVADSAFALVAMRGSGTLMLRNRHSRVTGTSAFTLNNSMHGLVVPSTLDQVFNMVRVTIHPKKVSAAATDELYTLPTGNSIEIPAGETRTVWTDYSDPDDRQAKVGGTAVVTVLVGDTHYGANSAADGSGSSLTANITATIEPFASTAKWTLENTGSSTAYITTLKVIGKAVRDPGQQTVGKSSTQDYGTRPLSVDMKYQDDFTVAQDAATFLEAQRNAIANQIDTLEFIANDSATFMRQALAREPGDRITVTEPVTGIIAVDAIIQSVSLDVTPGPWIVCRWGLAPAAPWQAWQIGVVGVSELGVSTVLGF